MKALRFLLFPFALLYWLITGLRNWLYNIGVFKSSKFDLPIISVGNLSVGGTGKTPHVEYIARLLKGRYKVATLSRGFGRKRRGFVIANSESTVDDVGDEPLQFYHKFGSEITVVAEANRVKGVMDLMFQKPDTQVVLLDDAYQHRAIHRGLNILLTKYAEPFFQDYILPVGNLREMRSCYRRADLIIVTKCPDPNQVKKEEIVKKINPLKRQKIFFSTIQYGTIVRLFSDEHIDGVLSKNVVLVTGIADASQLYHHIAKSAKIVHHFSFADHHNYRLSDIREIHNIFGKFAPAETIILTTEKDAMRLMRPEWKEELSAFPWYHQTIEIALDDPDEFDKLILNYVETHSRDN